MINRISTMIFTAAIVGGVAFVSTLVTAEVVKTTPATSTTAIGDAKATPPASDPEGTGGLHRRGDPNMEDQPNTNPSTKGHAISRKGTGCTKTSCAKAKSTATAPTPQ